MSRGIAATIFVALSVLLTGGSDGAQAVDINGVWLSDARQCARVFQKKGGRVSFVKQAGSYGNGFIIAGDQIRGRIARCTIKTRREQDDLVNLIAVCSTDLAIDTMQFRLKVAGPNKIVREFPGLPDMEIAYERCPM